MGIDPIGKAGGSGGLAGARLLWLTVLFGCTPAPIPRSTEHPSVAAAQTPPLAQPSCDIPNGHGSPWVVDASQDQQRALDRSRSRGSMVFEYHCGRLRLLEDCRAPGSYTYATTTPQPLAVTIDADSQPAELPLTATANPLGAGESVRLEALTVGVWSSTVRVTHADELDGACAGATHIARNVVVGASNLRRGAAEPSSTAESSPNSKEMARGCQGAMGGSTPPAGCDDALRLALQPVLAERPPEAWASDGTAFPSATDAEGSSCTPESTVACERDCEAGAAAACVNVAIAHGRDDAVIPVYERACWLGHGQGCSEAATVLLSDARSGGSVTGHVAWRRACEGGLSSWCWSLGMALSSGKLEGLEGLSAYDAWELGCRHGSRESCYAAAQWRTSGGAGRLRVEDLLGASCPERSGGPEGNWNGCLALAGILEHREGGEARAAALYERVCDMKIRVGCTEAARMAEGGALNRELAERMYGEACRLGAPEACMRAAALAGDQAGRWYEQGCRRFRHGPACDRMERR